MLQIVKDGSVVYSSIDNTGSSDLAALGARYTMGRLDTLDGRFNGYYTKTEVLDLLTGMASTYIVATLPVAPIENTYYMVGNDSDGYVLHYYDHDLEHAIVGSYELDLSSVSPQKAALPAAGAEHAGKVYQYIGTTQARYTRGKWYECRNQVLYAWLHTTNAWVMYTYNEVPSYNEYIRNEDGVPYMYPVRSVSGNTLTDMNGDTWTRNSGADSSAYLWFDLADGAASSVFNADLTPGKVVTTTARGKLTTTNVNTGEVNYLSGARSNIQNQLDNLETTNLKSGVLATAIGTSTSNTKIPSEKAVGDYAVKKTSDASKVYGTDSSGAAANYALQAAMPDSPTDLQIPTAKLVDSLTKFTSVTGADALTLKTNNPITATSFNSYAVTQILKLGKLCVFSTHITFTKNSSNAMWIVVANIKSGYRPKRNTVFTGALWDTGTTFGIGGHITTEGDIRWWCDGNGRSAITNGQLRFVCIYECA